MFQPVAKPDCTIKSKVNPDQTGPGGDGGDGPNTQCELVTDSVDLNQCTPEEVVFKHVKKVPHCENVTSLNCETGWKVVNGKKVFPFFYIYLLSKFLNLCLIRFGPGRRIARR